MNLRLRAYVTILRERLTVLRAKAHTPTQKRRKRRRILTLKRPVDAAIKALPQRLRARIRRREEWVAKNILRRLYPPRKIEALWWEISPFCRMVAKCAKP